ncbi:MAG: type II toxin-antitoxin system HicA family toxin [Deltaproteobacteria bacterium]|nr:type II toxin-antitoxin system HicA family toxin [Deltaproteobacteria bacterium]
MKPPLLSGRQIVAALRRIGYDVVSQKGSHITLKHPHKEFPLIVPNHPEVDRWTLKSILHAGEISVKEFLKAL